ncbi:MAG TPA: RimK-like ATPgrasp N-terminal domain-containing protein, partial [candidate division Zixibacteria bacterium]|nr:RimK-like ATPgrasp N-terminal domain-containing protein [candidate division Zixibacteria bacterium]
INPFMLKSRIVLKPGREKPIAKSMTRNYTYAICCQKLDPGDKVFKFRSVLGWCTNPEFRHLSKFVLEVFHVPLATVRVVIKKNGAILLSDISPLEFNDLRATEFEYLEGKISWGK